MPTDRRKYPSIVYDGSSVEQPKRAPALIPITTHVSSRRELLRNGQDTELGGRSALERRIRSDRGRQVSQRREAGRLAVGRWCPDPSPSLQVRHQLHPRELRLDLSTKVLCRVVDVDGPLLHL